jgi:LacI family transcriptional regulator
LNKFSKSKKLTMKMLAIEAGVSQSTVSLALRDDPRLRLETRKRIQQLAQTLGYRPDPALSALVAYRAQTRPPGDYGKIGILHDWDQLDRLPLSYRQQIDGMSERAESLGYQIELFRVNTEDSHSQQLSRTLYVRGIRGIILASLRMPALRMEWKHFSAVVVGEYFSDPQLNHVGNHHASVLTSTYQALKDRGYRRIGFCNSIVSEARKHHLYLGAYLKCLYLDGIVPDLSPPFLYDDRSDWSPLNWLDQYGFDAVMSLVPSTFLKKLEGSVYTVPERLGVAGYAMPLGQCDSRIAGCALDYHRIGAAAVDLLQSMLQHSQRGVPAENEHYDLLIRGQWTDGASIMSQS